MFIDLLEEEIQPAKLDVATIPEVEIPAELQRLLEEALIEEEESYAQISSKNSVVQRDKNYVFFSNQWFYLAVICKKYAEALKPYGDFFDANIRGNQRLIDIVSAKDYSNPEWISLIPDADDRTKMEKYIEPDIAYRPGKALVNGDKPRSIKDIFGSCILKKLSVPDASSGYLGDLVYYLVKRPDLYNSLEKEIKAQIPRRAGARKLSGITKECAKQIIDCVYDMDGFDAIKHLLEVNDKNIKIDVAKADVVPVGNYLRYLFARPSSDLFAGNSDKPRVFTDRDYVFSLEEEDCTCRLTTEWVDVEPSTGSGNYLKTLIQVINKFYADRLVIRTEFGERYLYMMKENFSFNDLPDIFDSKFAKRFITSLMAKPFVILTGNSGTGKTRIAKQFAEFLECISTVTGRKNWEIVPVGADWTDNAKVLGFYNPIADGGKGKYEKSVILKLIEDANENKSIPYFLILDEMNLSHVERYFSDFLSHMETPDTPFDLDGYGSLIEYPDNLFVVGTVNIDETTYMFSPKVLDRANVIEFKPDKEDVMRLFTNSSVKIRVTPAADGTAEAFLKKAKQVREGKIGFEGYDVEVDGTFTKYDMSYVERVFSEVYEIVEENGFEFAYRTVKEIRRYIAAADNLFSDGKLDLINAIDEQMIQKILPKIHGNKKEIGELLEKLQGLCEKEKLFESTKKIEQMKGKLAKVQYASFI